MNTVQRKRKNYMRKSKGRNKGIIELTRKDLPYHKRDDIRAKKLPKRLKSWEEKV